MNSRAGSLILLGRAWTVALAIRLALRVLPFARVLEIVQSRSGASRSSRAPAAAPERIAAAVRRAGRLVPGGSCLSRALAVHVLLSRAGYPPRLRIGLRQAAGGELRAHAWVESGGRVVLGAEEMEGFVPLPGLEKS